MYSFKIEIKHGPTVYLVYRTSSDPGSGGVAKSVDRDGAQSSLNQL